MKLKIIIPLFLFCSLYKISKAQTTKEWYFFDPLYLLNNGGYNTPYNNPPLHHDSLLFGFIGNGSYHWVYKYTHRQGFIKKTKFVGINDYIEAADMCIDTLNKFIFTFSRSLSRPPLNKFSHGIVFKLDYNLNILDSTIITYSTFYDPGPMILNHNKLYVVGHNNNYFNTPEKINITVLDLNLQQLYFKVVSDSLFSSICRKIVFDSKNNLRLFITGGSSSTGSISPKPMLILDTNLAVISNTCLLNRCYPPNNYLFPSNIVKDNNGFTYSFDDYVYKTNFQPYPYIQDYHVRVNENEDTINSTYFFKNLNAGDIYTDRVTHLQKIKNNGYIGLGSLYSYSFGADPNNSGKFFIMDSTLKIINQFNVLKYTTANFDNNVDKIKIGQTGSGMYYLTGEAKDSTQTNYKGVFYLMTIDSTAKLPPITQTVIPNTQQIWDNVTVFPNPTTDVVTIAVPQNTKFNVNVYNTLGQSLISFPNVISDRQISLSNLPVGVYHFVFYETSLKKGITKKVILQK